MALPRIDTPTYELTLPLSKKKINFRPFLVKEQKNLMMAIEANDSETIERNIKQVLHNCTLSENIDIDKLPVLDVEYYFIQLRARSVGEVVENNYICTNKVDDKECNNKMSISLNLLELQVEKNPQQSDIIQLTNKISIKLKYPEFSTIEKIKQKTTSVEIAFQMIVDSIEYIFDGEQYYYANETTPEELMGFVEELNNDQFAKIEDFFDNLPKLNKTVQMICSKCGYDHSINVEGLESFFV
jgi:hypothetical protein